MIELRILEREDNRGGLSVTMCVPLERARLTVKERDERTEAELRELTWQALKME